MAIRLSIGASRARLIGQLLTESLLLAVLGGTAGMVVAHWTLVLVISLLPPEVQHTITFSISGTVILFGIGLTFATGLLFGLFPALHSTRPDLVSTLKNQAGQPSGGRRAARVRAGLVTAQITLSMLLLVGAGLFAKSLVNVSRVDLGFNVDRLVTFTITPVMNGYTPARALVLFNQVEDGLSALPGVTSVSATAIPLVGGDNWGTDVVVQGFDGGPGMDTSQYNAVDTDFFRTAGIPMMAGRDFTRADILGAPKVAIVNHAFVRKFTLEPHAIGARLRRGGPDSHSPFDTEIVGVVQDSGYSDVKEDIPPVLYTPYRQDKRAGAGAAFYVRTSGDPGALLHAIPGVVRALDATLPVDALRTMPQQVRENIAVDRTITMLAVAFAVLATLLAGIGLYGVLAYTVSQRTREIGLRMALGAAPASIAGLVLHQVARLTIVGAVLGGAAALLSGRYVESLLFRVQGQDATVTGGALIVLILVAASAGYLPAFRASRVDPMRALRQD
jgi:predicted permease